MWAISTKKMKKKRMFTDHRYTNPHRTQTSILWREVCRNSSQEFPKWRIIQSWNRTAESDTYLHINIITVLVINSVFNKGNLWFEAYNLIYKLSIFWNNIKELHYEYNLSISSSCSMNTSVFFMRVKGSKRFVFSLNVNKGFYVHNVWQIIHIKGIKSNSRNFKNILPLTLTSTKRIWTALKK